MDIADMRKNIADKALWIKKAKKLILDDLCPNIQAIQALIYEKEVEIYNLNDKLKQQRNKGERL